MDTLEQRMQKLEGRIHTGPSGAVDVVHPGLAEYGAVILQDAQNAQLSLQNWTHIHLSEEHALGVHIFTFGIWGQDLPDDLTEETLPTRVKKFIQDFKDDDNPPYKVDTMVRGGYKAPDIGIDQRPIIIIAVYYGY